MKTEPLNNAETKAMPYDTMLVAGLCMEDYLKLKTAPRIPELWWQKYPEYEPYLCDTIISDGLQLVRLWTIDDRPHHWLIRIDSSTDVNADDFDYDEGILQHIEEECGICDCDDMCDCEYPIIRWGGGGWGMVANFATGIEGS